jgi:Raf kinase inhibitor-like YbhB/YbcL family protein
MLMKYTLKNGLREISLLQNKRRMEILICAAFILASQFMGMEVTGMGALKLSSPAFKNDQMIPSKHTCDGADVNPTLVIENVPSEAKSLALIMDDPDAPAGTWVHWVIWNIDPRTREIREGSVPPESVRGINDFRKHTYGGPCPPSGTHRYFFKLYALDDTLTLDQNTAKAVLEHAMKGHIVAQSELIGLYKRK